MIAIEQTLTCDFCGGAVDSLYGWVGLSLDLGRYNTYRIGESSRQDVGFLKDFCKGCEPAADELKRKVIGLFTDA